MTRTELDLAVEWAAREGWNPGLHDAQPFWETDPEGFVAAELDGELAGMGSTVSYGGRYGFMGFFIVRPDLRRHRLGDVLYHHLCDRMRSRLEPGAPIGIDGVYAMAPWYAKGGFQLAHRDVRFEFQGAPPVEAPAGIVPLAGVDPASVEAYDALHFPAPRPGFLARWIRQPGVVALAVPGAGGKIEGLGVLRPCRTGHKVGPLLANDPQTAEALLAGLAVHARGGPMYLDVPEPNGAAMALARRWGMKEVFGCARMYLNRIPSLPLDRIYGITTFELG